MRAIIDWLNRLQIVILSNPLHWQWGYQPYSYAQHGAWAHVYEWTLSFGPVEFRMHTRWRDAIGPYDREA